MSSVEGASIAAPRGWTVQQSHIGSFENEIRAICSERSVQKSNCSPNNLFAASSASHLEIFTR